MSQVVGEYTLVRKLGKGAYAEVFLCSKGGGGSGDNLVAIKVFNKPLLRKKKEWTKKGKRMVMKTAMNDVEREIVLMKRLKHPKIVSLYEVINDTTEDRLFMVLEYVSGGDLMDWDPKKARFTTRNGKASLAEAEARTYFRDLVEAVAHIHAYQIVHRDIKPQNLLLTGDGHCKLGDFGVAHVFDPETEGEQAGATEGKVKDAKGTYAFMAPECFTGDEYSAFAAEVWSLGVTLYAMLTGRLPFFAPSELELIDAVEQQPVPWPKSLPMGARALLERMLEKDPARRISVDDLCTHEWVCAGGSLEPVPLPDMSAVNRSVSQEELSRAISFMGSAFINLRLLQAANRAKRRKRPSEGGAAGLNSGSGPHAGGEGPQTAHNVVAAGSGAAVSHGKRGCSESSIRAAEHAWEEEDGGGPEREQAPKGCCVVQ